MTSKDFRFADLKNALLAAATHLGQTFPDSSNWPESVRLTLLTRAVSFEGGEWWPNFARINMLATKIAARKSRA